MRLQEQAALLGEAMDEHHGLEGESSGKMRRKRKRRKRVPPAREQK